MGGTTVHTTLVAQSVHTTLVAQSVHTTLVAQSVHTTGLPKCPEAAALRRSRDNQGTYGLTKEDRSHRKVRKYEK